MTLSVKVGELKNHLSAYLKKVRQGAIVMIADRDTPIGKIIPYGNSFNEEVFDILKPSNGYEGLAKLSFASAKLALSPTELLIEERRKR